MLVYMSETGAPPAENGWHDYAVRRSDTQSTITSCVVVPLAAAAASMPVCYQTLLLGNGSRHAAILLQHPLLAALLLGAAGRMQCRPGLLPLAQQGGDAKEGRPP